MFKHTRRLGAFYGQTPASTHEPEMQPQSDLLPHILRFWVILSWCLLPIPARVGGLWLLGGSWGGGGRLQPVLGAGAPQLP